MFNIMNPILPVQHFVPDAEARQWKDGRMYIYGSYDISGDSAYCSKEYHVFSSDDLISWVDHGQSFNMKEVPWATGRLYAPDCIYKEGLYYLYFCCSDQSEGVATSIKPEGPFKDASPIDIANGDGIDPAIFIDDDGQAYYYWGQYNLRGGRLKEDMTTIDKNTLCTDLINEDEHGFHEGASMCKHNGIYYLLYTDISGGRATRLSYATSNSPLGPFVKQGCIIDNTGCDPETWNNHGSIAEFNGNWYLFYHRSSQGSKFSRRVCIEPITFNEDGSIDQVEMTTQGVSEPLRATGKIDAYRACLLSGEVKTEVIYNREDDHIKECLSDIEDGDWAAYKYINFQEEVAGFELKAASLAYGGKIEIRLDGPEGEIIGVCPIKRTGGWQKWETFKCSVENVSGVHAIYLVFKGGSGRLYNLLEFKFN